MAAPKAPTGQRSGHVCVCVCCAVRNVDVWLCALCTWIIDLEDLCVCAGNTRADTHAEQTCLKRANKVAQNQKHTRSTRCLGVLTHSGLWSRAMRVGWRCRCDLTNLTVIRSRRVCFSGIQMTACSSEDASVKIARFHFSVTRRTGFANVVFGLIIACDGTQKKHRLLMSPNCLLL